MREASVLEVRAGSSRIFSLPAWVRWAAVLWLAVWFPAYAVVHGWGNFLHLCDIAVILTCIGLLADSAQLLSSQAISSIVVDLIWTADVLWRQFTGKALIAGIDYMWDPKIPLWVRLLSLYHVLLPFLLFWMLARMGYDRRGLSLQSVIAVLAMIAARLLTNPAANINYAFRDPLFGRPWGPAPVHLLLMFFGLFVIVYWPTHWALAKLFPAPTRAH